MFQIHFVGRVGIACAGCPVLPYGKCSIYEEFIELNLYQGVESLTLGDGPVVVDPGERVIQFVRIVYCVLIIVISCS